MRTARVSLPLGMGLNPSAANGLAACSDAQFGKGTRNPVACPPASKIGTVAIETPPLPEGPLTGNVYLGEQKSRDPESGEEYRIFVDAESPRYGVSVRLIGNVIANAKTGQLTAVFDEPAKTNVLRGGNDDNLPSGLPQVPFTCFKLSIDGGPKAALSSPPTCGPNQTDQPADALVGQRAPRRRRANSPSPSLPAAAPARRRWASGPSRPASTRSRKATSPKPSPPSRPSSPARPGSRS